MDCQATAARIVTRNPNPVIAAELLVPDTLTNASILSSTCPDSSSQSASTAAIPQEKENGAAWMLMAVFATDAEPLARKNCCLVKTGPSNTVNVWVCWLTAADWENAFTPPSNWPLTVMSRLAPSGPATTASI